MRALLRDNRAAVIVLATLFGAAWGLIEMSLGGLLHAIHFPHKGLVLGGIGAALMASFVLTTRRPGLVLWLGAIAACLKLLDAPLLGVAPFSPAIVNPATAILLEALAFCVAAGFLVRDKRLQAATSGQSGDPE